MVWKQHCNLFEVNPTKIWFQPTTEPFAASYENGCSALKWFDKVFKPNQTVQYITAQRLKAEANGMVMCLFYLTGTTGTSSNSSVQRDKVQLCSANTSSVHGNIIRGRTGKSVPARKKLLCSPRSWPHSPSHLALQKRRHEQKFSARIQKVSRDPQTQRMDVELCRQRDEDNTSQGCTWCLGTHGKRTLQCPNHQQIHAIDPKSWKWFRGVKRKPLLAAISPWSLLYIYVYIYICICIYIYM